MATSSKVYWEESASNEVGEIFNLVEDYETIDKLKTSLVGENIFIDNNPISAMRAIVDHMIDKRLWTSDPYDIKTRPDDYSASTIKSINKIIKHNTFLWQSLACCSIFYSKQEHDQYNFVSYKNKTQSILIKKQRDYGPKNIARFGLNGIIIRTHDKVARLENLVERRLPPENESLMDNLLDIIGYSAIAIMWCKDTFLLPLENKSEKIYLERTPYYNMSYSKKYIEISPIPRHMTSYRVEGDIRDI